MIRPRHDRRPPHASASALTIVQTPATVAPIRLLRPRKPLRFYGYPLNDRLADRIVPSVLLLCAVSYWFATTPAIAAAAGQ